MHSTGKAAARLLESVREAQQREGSPFDAADRERLGSLTATTMHRLLGWRPDSGTRFRHHRGNRLPHDLVVVDEASMVSLPMMDGLLAALAPSARLVLLGDPDQLASVEAGAVFGDVRHAVHSIWRGFLSRVADDGCSKRPRARWSAARGAATASRPCTASPAPR